MNNSEVPAILISPNVIDKHESKIENTVVTGHDVRVIPDCDFVCRLRH